MATAALPTRDDFAALLEETLGADGTFEGKVVKGIVTAIENDLAVIDVGLKSEGRVRLSEFAAPGQKADLKVGDEVEVFVDRVENMHGEAMLSRDRARREAAWDKLEQEFTKSARVDGVIFGRVKGGFTVDLDGAVAFLPGSQVDIRPVRDVQPLMDIPQPFQILKMDRKRGNIVVSRRAILEESRAEARTGLISTLSEGQIIDGVVKNITDYGAFVDLGGIDGLLHVTDMSYKRVNHPSEVINIGDTVKVQIVRINKDTQRISLGMKQLESDPWEGAEAKYAIGTKLSGRVTNITEYGAFVELEPGIEGLVHVSEMSWTKKNVHPGKIVSTSQEVEVIVLEVDSEKRRVSLGLKQAISNPWEQFEADHPVGSTVEGEVKNSTEFGLFIGLDGDVDGMVHMSDIAWGISGEDALNLHRKGETVQAIVLAIEADKERISLGMKQLEKGAPAMAGSAAATSGASVAKNAIVTVTVLEVRDGGLEVQIGDDGATGFIKRSDLGRDRDEQRAERFQTGQKFDAMVTGFDRSKKPTFSIKAMQMAEEKQAVAQYGSSDSGASLGDILGEALKAREPKA
ncbi:30S ribosomal protein S1 [Sphingomonas sp. SUN039]|uniref:30S ribosomal protein S1 n=1 Tax=Sphingomonas sp. SUN039 TaxID=2937787 RepID=UPI002164407E|nr:30S ribosomal protein S1 [Sphingomonas sp. SUN039]UVO54162.1 30S ribosomal protein S1 [Sphingomonas sp. SUN039]